MAISIYAQKLLAWFNIYQISPTVHAYNLQYKRKANRRGIYVTALAELVAKGY